MKSTTYRITMSDRHKMDVVAGSAAEAINEALWRCRGETVKEIHSGFTPTEAKDAGVMGGIISYEIPEHRAISEDAVKPRATVRRTDSTEPMFEEAAMKGGKLAD